MRFTTLLATLTLLFGLAACRGSSGTVEEVVEPATPEPAFDPPPCSGDKAFDHSAFHGGGQLRLCILPGEVRLWALGETGRPDEFFHKSNVDLYFEPEGGAEQMISGRLLKGDAHTGWSTRLVGHEGAGVASARIQVGDDTLTFP